MSGRRTRRSVLGLFGTCGATLVAGCQGSTDAETDASANVSDDPSDEDDGGPDESEAADEEEEEEAAADDEETDSPSYTGGWEMFQRSARNDGVAGEAGPRDDPALRWRYTTNYRIPAGAAAAGDAVYVGSGDWDSRVHAIDAATGEKRWATDVGSAVTTVPAVRDGLVVAGTEAGAVVALEAADGTERWRYETAGTVRSSPTIERATVYVGSDDGGLYALALSDGAERWTFETGDAVTGAPAVAGSTVVVGSRDATAYGLDAVSGDVRWRHGAGSAIRAAPAVADGRAYVGSAGSGAAVTALDLATGDVVWTFDVRGAVSGLAVDGTSAYAATEGNRVYAIDGDGSRRWRARTDRAALSAPAVADETVYVGCFDENVYAFDAADGEERWRYGTDGPVRGTPAVADGTVYATSEDTKLYALSERQDEDGEDGETGN